LLSGYSGRCQQCWGQHHIWTRSSVWWSSYSMCRKTSWCCGMVQFWETSFFSNENYVYGYVCYGWVLLLLNLFRTDCRNTKICQYSCEKSCYWLQYWELLKYDILEAPILSIEAVKRCNYFETPPARRAKQNREGYGSTTRSDMFGGL
jgi:hypothetical protein